VSTVQELVAQLQASGIRMALSPQGKLLVSPPGRLNPELLDALKQRKGEVLALLTPPWRCEHCGLPAEIEAVEPRRSDGVLLTYWRCPPCQTWAVTPATLREPPVWVSKKIQ